VSAEADDDNGDGVVRRATATADAGDADYCRAPVTSTVDARRRTGGGALRNGGRGW